MESSASSSVLSVWRVGDVRIEAALEMGSKEATLERREGIETRERVRKGQRGGRSGVGALAVLGGRSRLGRGVSTSSVLSMGAGGVVGAMVGGFGLESGDFLSEPLRSLALPRTAFRSEPLRLRLLLFWSASDMALRPGVRVARSLFSLSLFSPSLVRSMFNRESKFPEIDLLCVVAGLFFSLDLGVSSWMVGNGIGDSASFVSVAESFIA